MKATWIDKGWKPFRWCQPLVVPYLHLSGSWDLHFFFLWHVSWTISWYTTQYATSITAVKSECSMNFFLLILSISNLLPDDWAHSIFDRYDAGDMIVSFSSDFTAATSGPTLGQPYFIIVQAHASKFWIMCIQKLFNMFQQSSHKCTYQAILWHPYKWVPPISSILPVIYLNILPGRKLHDINCSYDMKESVAKI